jgi:hypothetical protein
LHGFFCQRTGASTPLHPHPKAHCSNFWHRTAQLWRYFYESFCQDSP